MNIPPSTCPVCDKPKGGFTKRIDHSECSKELQRKFEALNNVKEELRRLILSE